MYLSYYCFVRVLDRAKTRANISTLNTKSKKINQGILTFKLYFAQSKCRKYVIQCLFVLNGNGERAVMSVCAIEILFMFSAAFHWNQFI